MRSPREFSLGFGTIKAYFWCCSGLLPEVSPVFDRTKTILGEIAPTYASFLEVSLEMLPPREFSLGFGTIKASFWRCSDLLPEVPPVFYRTEATLGEIFPTHASLPEVSLEMRPPVSSLSGSVPSRHLFGAVEIYYRRSLQYSIVQKLLLGKYFHLTLAFQRSLWKCVPTVSPLSGSVSSRHCFGDVPIHYRRSIQYSIVQKLLLGKNFHLTPAFQRSLWKCAPSPEFSLVFGAIKTSFWRCSDLLPEVSPASDRTEATLEEIFPHTPAFQRSFWKCVPP